MAHPVRHFSFAKAVILEKRQGECYNDFKFQKRRRFIVSKTNEKRPDYLVLINGESRMPDGFENTVELISVQHGNGSTLKVERKTYEAYLRLQADLLENDGIQTVLLESYRTVEKQEAIFARYLEKGGLEYAAKYVAKPGCSEHHTGLAIDVGIVWEGKLYSSVEQMLSVDDLFGVVQKKLPKYGFILRYPKGKTEITKIAYEPWHFRYLDSPEIAREITDKGICYEEYFADR